MSEKRVMVTGASGFIGRCALPELAQRGYEVHALCSRTPPAEAPAATWHAVDLMDDRAMRAVVEQVRPTHLLHLAWYAVPGKYGQAIENFRWVTATMSLLEAFAGVGGRRAMLAGTCFEYDLQHGQFGEADAPLTADNPYRSTKRATGILAQSLARKLGVSLAWGRIFYVYGPYEAPGRLVSSVCESLLAGRPAECSHGRQVRDYMHVADVAGAFAAVLDSVLEGPVNICTGIGATVREIVERLAARIGRSDLLRLGALQAPADDPASVVGQVGRLRDEALFTPRYDLHSGLDQTVDWWCARQAAAGKDR